MKRLTAEKLADLFFQAARDLREPETMQSAIAYQTAAENVRDNIIPQWQDEPDGEGEYYVRGIERVCWVYREDTEGQPWAIEHVVTDFGTGIDSLRLEPLNGRRVCPIGARPQ